MMALKLVHVFICRLLFHQKVIKNGSFGNNLKTMRNIFSFHQFQWSICCMGLKTGFSFLCSHSIDLDSLLNVTESIVYRCQLWIVSEFLGKCRDLLVNIFNILIFLSKPYAEKFTSCEMTLKQPVSCLSRSIASISQKVLSKINNQLRHYQPLVQI